MLTVFNFVVVRKLIHTESLTHGADVHRMGGDGMKRVGVLYVEFVGLLQLFDCFRFFKNI